MNNTEISRLRALPIEGVAERLGLHVDRHKSLCPFHDDHHASLTYNTRRNTFHMYPDSDAPGERLFNQLKEALPHLQRHTLPPGCKDYAEYYLTTLNP